MSDFDGIEYDERLDEYVGQALDGHEVFGQTRARCYDNLREANRVIADEWQHNQERPSIDEDADRYMEHEPDDWERDHSHQYRRTDGRTYTRPRP
jgi:hypothetical protein